MVPLYPHGGNNVTTQSFRESIRSKLPPPVRDSGMQYRTLGAAYAPGNFISRGYGALESPGEDKSEKTTSSLKRFPDILRFARYGVHRKVRHSLVTPISIESNQRVFHELAACCRPCARPASFIRANYLKLSILVWTPERSAAFVYLVSVHSALPQPNLTLVNTV